MRSIRTLSITALVLTVVALAGGQSPWLTSNPDPSPVLIALFTVVLPLAAVLTGGLAVRAVRSQLGTTTSTDRGLAWAALLVPAAWLALRLAFLIGELIGHE